MLTLADIGVEFLRLLESHPHRRAETLNDCRRPQQQNIDPAIGNAICAQRQRNAPFGMLRAPRLHPWPDALLKLLDDLIGNPLIEIASWSHLLEYGLQLLLPPCPSARPGVVRASRLRTRIADGAPRRAPPLRGEEWGCGGTCLDVLRVRGAGPLALTGPACGHVKLRQGWKPVRAETRLGAPFATA